MIKLEGLNGLQDHFMLVHCTAGLTARGPDRGLGLAGFAGAGGITSKASTMSS